jgi:hypothetical protein
MGESIWIWAVTLILSFLLGRWSTRIYFMRIKRKRQQGSNVELNWSSVRKDSTS